MKKIAQILPFLLLPALAQAQVFVTIDSIASYKQGIAAIEAQNYEAAIPLFRAAQAQYVARNDAHGSLQAQLLIADAQKTLGDKAAAFAIYEQIDQKYAAQPAFATERAYALMRLCAREIDAGKAKNAETYLNQGFALTKNIANPHKKHWLGRFYNCQGRIAAVNGQHKLALAAYQNALQQLLVLPKNRAINVVIAVLYSNIGATYEKIEDVDNAFANYREGFDKINAVAPTSLLMANAHFGLCYSLEEQGNYTAALYHYRECVRLRLQVQKKNR
jgi:tetratricopeptide (TPR) repeat protein